MAGSLPPNNGSAQHLRFEKVGTSTMRESIATGVLNSLEFGLLKGSSKKSSGTRSDADRLLGWGVEEKGVLLNMEVEELRAIQGDMELKVQVRSLCYSRGVTADYLQSHERFNMKQCVLVLGDLGKGAAPWSELVQPAVFLHRKEFNIIWIDVPTFKSNPQEWLKFGAEILRGLLKFFCVKQASVISRGIGGAVFLEALAKSPSLFARTHFVYNMDLPAGKGVHLPIFELEEVLRKQELQLWFAFKDDEIYDRNIDGTPLRAYEAVNKLQARLVGERQRGHRTLNYDEVLITENLNANPRMLHCQPMSLSIYTILVFSAALLESMAFFLEIAPGTHQDGMDDGLVGDFRAIAHTEALAGSLNDNEPLAIRRTRIGHLHGLQNRHGTARGNLNRLKNVEKAISEMMTTLPAVQNGANASFGNELTRRLGDEGSGSAFSSRSGSRTNSRGGSRGGSRASGSRTGTKDRVSGDFSAALPALLRGSMSSSTPNLQALGDGSVNSDSEDEGLLGTVPDGQQPWQHYRKVWQDMHGKKPTGYTHPMKKI